MDARFNREDLIHRITKIADCAGRIEVTCADAVELTAWLEADDVKGRAMRARRLRNLLDTLPVPPDGLSFLGGGESAICFDEVRRCYLNGSDIAVVLLCLAYIERELTAELYAAGWEGAKKARLGAVLEKVYEDGVLSELRWRRKASCESRDRRNV